MMENRPEFLAITMGLAKVGVTIALINTSAKEKQLYHALTVSQTKVFILTPQMKANYLSSLPFFDETVTAEPCVWWYGQGTKSNRHLGHFVFTDNRSLFSRFAIVDLSESNKGKPDAKKRKVAEKRFDLNYATFPTSRLDKKARLSVKPRDPLFYIFTSGTTGASKAAKFSVSAIMTFV